MTVVVELIAEAEYNLKVSEPLLSPYAESTYPIKKVLEVAVKGYV